MTGVALPSSLDEALALLHADPAATVVAGGTDVMVELNYGHARPAAIISLRRVAELDGWRRDGGELWLGARLSYQDIERSELAGLVPALAQAARTVGSPQIRATGTLGGNLGTASPAGDTLPVLASLGATVELVSSTGRRALPLTEFVTGVKRTALQPGELIAGVRFPVPNGPQEFLKIGTRNAMVISIANCALVVDLTRRVLRCTLGSVGPAPVRCTEAEQWVADHVDWATARVDDPRTYETFGALCAGAARPITDHRSTANYRRHGCAVLARRALMRCL
jgi:CO/xanthine dehydrogenase FAD-binding subunit